MKYRQQFKSITWLNSPWGRYCVRTSQRTQQFLLLVGRADEGRARLASGRHRQDNRMMPITSVHEALLRGADGPRNVCLWLDRKRAAPSEPLMRAWAGWKAACRA